mgnify:CR=1 FL=1
MTREQLASASDTLRTASDGVDDESLRADLTEQADQMASLAEADRGPDHGRLARHEIKLSNLADAADEATADAIESALGDIRAYRSTIEGV